MDKIIYIFMLCVHIINSNMLSYDLEQLKYTCALEQCLQEIINKYLDSSENLAIYMEKHTNFNFLNMNKTKILYSLDNSTVNLVKERFYILITENTQISVILKYFASLPSWNPRAKFIIRSFNEDKEKILQICSKYFIVDVIVIEIDESLKLYSWDPYEVLCKSKMNAMYLGNCETISNTSSLYYQNVSNIWKECTLKVTAMHIAPYVYITKDGKMDGLEIRALKAIQENMGFNVIYINHNYKTWGLRREDRTYTEMFALLQKYQTDVVMGMWPTNYTHMWDFDVSYSYFQDALVWLVPKSKLQTRWKRLTTVFNKTLWFVVIILIISYGILWKSTSIFLQYELRPFKTLISCILLSLSVIFNVTIYKHPKTSTLRILFISWVCVSLILVTIYQSKLIASLTQPLYERQISNVEELLKSKLSFGANINIKTLFNNSFNDYEKRIYENIKICDLTLSCPNRTAFERDFATAKSELPAKFLISKYYTNPDGSVMIYVFKSKIMFHYVNMVFSYGHPIFIKFNEKLRRMFECGLFYKWMKDIQDEQWRNVYVPKDNKLSILTLEYMIAPFILLLMGLGISISVFTCEYSAAKINMNGLKFAYFPKVVFANQSVTTDH